MKHLAFPALCVAALSGCPSDSGGSVHFMDPSRWSRAYGGSPDWSEMSSKGILADRAGGGYFATATTRSFGAAEEDGWAIALRPDGSVEWARALGGADHDYFWSSDVTPGGDLIAAGSTYSFGAGGGDVWVVRRNAAGALLWQKAFGGALGEYGVSVRATPDGGCVVAAGSASFAGSTQPWLLKLDADGIPVWQRRYGFGEPWGMEATPDGGFVTFVALGNGETWIFKVDADGEPVWGFQYEMTGIEYVHAALSTSDGGLLVVGKRGVVPPNYDVWVMKLNSDGSVGWQFAIGGPDWEEAVGAVEEPGGGFVVAASRLDSGSWDGWLLRLGADGAIVSQAAYGEAGYEQFEHLRRAPDGGLLAQGITTSMGNGAAGGVADLWILKFNAAGVCPLPPKPTNLVPVVTAAVPADALPFADDTMEAGVDTGAVDRLATPDVATVP